MIEVHRKLLFRIPCRNRKRGFPDTARKNCLRVRNRITSIGKLEIQQRKRYRIDIGPIRIDRSASISLPAFTTSQECSKGRRGAIIG